MSTSLPTCLLCGYGNPLGGFDGTVRCSTECLADGHYSDGEWRMVMAAKGPTPGTLAWALWQMRDLGMGCENVHGRRHRWNPGAKRYQHAIVDGGVRWEQTRFVDHEHDDGWSICQPPVELVGPEGAMANNAAGGRSWLVLSGADGEAEVSGVIQLYFVGSGAPVYMTPHTLGKNYRIEKANQ